MVQHISPASQRQFLRFTNIIWIKTKWGGAILHKNWFFQTKFQLFGSVFGYRRPTDTFFFLFKYSKVVKEDKLIFPISLSLSYWNIIIMGCAHPQFGAVAQMVFRFYCWRAGYGTRSQNKWYCTIHKRSANKYKELKYCFYYYFTFEYSI